MNDCSDDNLTDYEDDNHRPSPGSDLPRGVALSDWARLGRALGSWLGTGTAWDDYMIRYLSLMTSRNVPLLPLGSLELNKGLYTT
jgi:hypothetical protein